MSFAGCVALVVGGGSGIGRASADLLAGRGATVMVADVNGEAARETAARIRNAGGQAVSDQCDVARWVDTEAAVRRARREFGRLHVTVNCAGILRIESLLTMSESEWSEVLRVNLTGAFLLTKADMTVMREQGHGAIVHIASRMAVRSMEGHGAYGASKAGILQLTQTAALEGASYGVRVNCVCPGFIDTPMTRTGQDDDPFAAWNRVCPLARPGRPDEVARAILFLASEEASFITGVALPVDGGRKIL